MTATTSIRIAFAAALVAAAAMVTGATTLGATDQVHGAQVTSVAMTAQKSSPVLCCDE